MVNVFNNEGKIIAKVEYNSNLDFWDGHNWTCGNTGRHLGITRLTKSKQFVLIHGTQWQGERDTAELISDREAFEAIVRSEKSDKFLDRWPVLKRFLPAIDSDTSENSLEEMKDRAEVIRAQLAELEAEIKILETQNAGA